MEYAFPSDLASQVQGRWTTFVARHDRPAPPLPSVEQLRYVLETAFLASFAREEGRNLRFALCCAPTAAVPCEGGGGDVPLIPFREPRPLSVEAIRALAPAVSPLTAAILVVCPPGDSAALSCTVAGVLSVGPNVVRWRGDGAVYQRPAPYALVVDVREAGEVHIYRGGIKLATLKSGSLQDQLAFSELEFLPISDILSQGVDVIRPRLRPPAHEPPRETSDFEWTALLNTILAIVTGLESHGHGGTLLVAAPGAERTLPVRAKFDVDERNGVLSDRFVRFINARHALVNARIARKEGRPGADAAELSHLQDAMLIAEEDLSNATDLTARLSAVDGALVISSDLRVVGFGAEIVVDASRRVEAFEVSGHAQRGHTWPAVDSESFGMRHRSALRCVGVAKNAAAFVVSQDGMVSLFWSQGDRVMLKRGVTISNPNMAAG
jgi:hypothetical protein